MRSSVIFPVVSVGIAGILWMWITAWLAAFVTVAAGCCCLYRNKSVGIAGILWMWITAWLAAFVTVAAAVCIEINPLA